MAVSMPLGAVLAALIFAAPAQATLVYVKDPQRAEPWIHVAADDGSRARRIGRGRDPVISPDGRWVAWVAAGTPEQVMLRRADRRSKPRRLARSAQVGELRFSPDSTQLGMALRNRLSVHHMPTRSSFTPANGIIRGFSFSPDSTSVVYGSAGRDERADAPSDLYVLEFDAGPRERITRDRKSLNPLWGARGIVHDRQRVREGDAPAYNLFEIQPDGGSLRRITSLRIPSLVSGLVPLELSGDGRRLLAEFVGQDARAAFTVNPRTGRSQLIGKRAEGGFVGFDLTADGRTVLGHSGGAEGRGDVVTVPYRGGRPRVLVKDAGFPDWSR
jgi:hypothetical protein